jgi:hypothetical protein
MDNNTLFATATRKKLRFSTTRGSLSTEDLWDLSLEDLDRLAIAADNAIQKAGTKSFIGRRGTSQAVDELKLEVLKSVIETRLSEAEKAKARADKRAQRDFLKSLLEKKQREGLEALTAEEIQKQLAELGDED